MSDIRILRKLHPPTCPSYPYTRGGVFVETTTPLPLQTRLQIRFRIPTQNEPIEVGGEVRWVEPGGAEQLPGMGIRFQGLRAREVWALNRFFQS